MTRISKHFTLEEFEATAVKANNSAPLGAVVNICHGVYNILEPLRLYLHAPVHISSGYRSTEVNAAVGGVSNSQHLSGCAADITCNGEHNFALMVDFLSNHAEVDQLLTGRGWLHVSWLPAGSDGYPRHDVRLNYYGR